MTVERTHSRKAQHYRSRSLRKTRSVLSSLPQSSLPADPNSKMKLMKNQFLTQDKQLTNNSSTKSIHRKSSSLRYKRIVRQRALRDALAKSAQDTFYNLLNRMSYEVPTSPTGYISSLRAEATASVNTSSVLSSIPDVDFDLKQYDLSEQMTRTRLHTGFYPHQSPILANWEHGPRLSYPRSSDFVTRFEFVASSTLATAHRLWASLPHSQALINSNSNQNMIIGVLNSAHPKNRGSSCLNGGNEQEECLLRQTTLYDSLSNSHAGSQFYAAHKQESDGSGLHDHAMLYSPSVVVFKDDTGSYIPPYSIDVVSSVPVNAETVYTKFDVDRQELEEGVRSVMRDRMGRILRLFEERGDKVLVLGAFGVGQCCNEPETVAEIWADLLGAPRESPSATSGSYDEAAATHDGAYNIDARSKNGHGKVQGSVFGKAFDRVVFAVPGKHLQRFENAFYARCLEIDMSTDEEDDDDDDEEEA